MYCAAPNPYTPQGRSLEIPRERGSQKPKVLKESMKLNGKFQVGRREVGFKPKNLPGAVWIFSGTTHSTYLKYGERDDPVYD